jgi:hypothetical protein
MKSYLEFAHAEVQDLKEQIGNAKNSEEENRNRIVELEEAQLCTYQRPALGVHPRDTPGL